MPTEKINYEDVLREGTDKLNKSIENANQAEINSNEAKQTSNMALNVAEQANQKSDNTQTQLDTMVIESGTSDAEVLQARQNERGKEFPLLYQRLNNLDKEFEQRGVNVKWFGASGSDQSTIGSISSGSNELTVVDAIDFEKGQGILIEGAGSGGVAEVAELQITSPPTIAGQVVITLDGIATNVDVDPSVETTAIAVADKIRNTSFAGWTTGGIAGTDTVTFTRDTVGTKQNATFNANGTGVSGSMVTTTEGQDGGYLLTSITDINGKVITLSDNASTDATNVNVMHDDSIAIQSAISSSFGSDIFFPQGMYLVFNSITATISNNKRFVSSSKVELKYTGDSNSHMMSIDLAGNDIEFLGDIAFNGNSKSSRGILIKNITSTMENAVRLYADNLKLRNFYSKTEGVGSFGLRITGGFNSIELDRVLCENISRAQGVGVPYLQGSVGIQVTHDGIDSYAKQVVLNNPVIKNVTSDELDGDSNNLDCDGISIFAPQSSQNNDIPLEAHLIVSGGYFEDCRGRSIKSQMATNSINSPTFVRGGIKSIVGGNEIDIQRGLATIKDVKVRYHVLSDGSSPFGDSFVIITGSSDSQGFMLVDGVEVINNVPTSLSVPYFLTTPNTIDENAYSSVVVRNISIMGQGGVRSIVRGNLSGISVLTVDNTYSSRLTHALIDSVAMSNNRINASGNYQSHSTKVPLLRGVNVLNSLQSGHNNIGFIETLDSNRYEEMSDTLRASKLMSKDADRGGTFSIEAFNFGNNETKLFSQRGYVNNLGIYFISCAWSTSTQGIFAVLSNSISELAVPVGSKLIFGNGSDPNEPDSINVWATNEGIYVKNTSGSSRVITLAAIG